MKEKQGITKREKMLIFILSLVAFVYLAFQFGFMPLHNRYIVADGERTALIAQKQEIDRNIANKASIVEDNRIANARFDEIKQDYPLLVPTEVVDSVLTNLCLTNSLFPSSLRMSKPENSPAGEDERLQIFQIINAAMGVSGAYSSLLNLLDDVGEVPNMRVTNMSYSSGRTEETIGYGTMTLNFELVFIDR
jgi:Tfp pilus assembly protein PilO